MRHKHPVNQEHHDARDRIGQMVDAVCLFMGSLKFIALQTVLVALWVALNVVAFSQHWDPYPFILLNLAFSLQSAYATPLIMLSQNRQSQHDREVAEHDHTVNQQTLALLRIIARKLISMDPKDD